MNLSAAQTTDIEKALKASKRGFVGAGVFSLFINLLMLTAPLYMLQVYDRVVASRSMDTLFYLTLLMLGMFAVMGVLEVVRSRILVRVSNQLDHYLSARIYTAMFELGVRAPDQRSSQALQDFTSLRQFLTGNGLFAFFDAPWLPIYILILFLFHPAFGIFAIVAALMILTVAVINEKSTRKLLSEANGENIKAQNLAASNLRNAEVLHAMGMLPNIMGRWLEQHRIFMSKQTDASDKAGVYTNTSKVMRMAFQSLILGIGAYYVVLNEMSAGMMIAGSILMGRALAPMDMLINSWSGFNNTRMAYSRLRQLLTIIPVNDRQMRLPPPKGRISVEGLVVAPPAAKKPVLRGVSFEVAAGESVGIVGPSAAGKSTLARAMLGIWPAVNGSVRLDGAEIKHYNPDELGPYIGYLPQDIELFNGTIGENIARFGELDPEKVVEAARRAGVHEMILRMPDAYDTHIGVDSGALSGGQRQRVGLARALYGSPKLILLDEPNSNLDEQGERALAETMVGLKEAGITTFVITHRSSILRSIDKLLVLKDGAVDMFGPRDDVLKALAQNQQAATTAELARTAAQ